MSKIKLTAPDGKKLRHIPTDRLYSEVITDEKYASRYVVADSEEDPIVYTMNATTLDERISDLEDAVIELASIIGGE